MSDASRAIHKIFFPPEAIVGWAFFYRFTIFVIGRLLSIIFFCSHCILLNNIAILKFISCTVFYSFIRGMFVAYNSWNPFADKRYGHFYLSLCSLFTRLSVSGETFNELRFPLIVYLDGFVHPFCVFFFLSIGWFDWRTFMALFYCFCCERIYFLFVVSLSVFK